MAGPKGYLYTLWRVCLAYPSWLLRFSPLSPFYHLSWVKDSVPEQLAALQINCALIHRFLLNAHSLEGKLARTLFMWSKRLYTLQETYRCHSWEHCAYSAHVLVPWCSVCWSPLSFTWTSRNMLHMEFWIEKPTNSSCIEYITFCFTFF